MGSFDCYCVLCGGPLGIGNIKFGSRKRKALEKRRRYVETEKRKRQGEQIDELDEQEDKIGGEDEEMADAGHLGEEEAESSEDEYTNPFAPPNPQEEASWGDDAESDFDYEATSISSTSSSDSESICTRDSDLNSIDILDVPIPPPSPDLRDPDCWSQWSDIPIWENFNPYRSSYSNKEDREAYEEHHTYDPEKLLPEDYKWIDRCRCLAFNADAPGITKAFISGRGRYDDYGAFHIKEPGRDPNDSGEDYHNCYYNYATDERSSFPFHEECYKILAKALGHEQYQRIDKDVLHSVMAANMDAHATCLSLDYGHTHGREQFWENIPGEEFSLCDPGLRLGFEDVLHTMLPARLLHDSRTMSAVSHKSRSDPFSIMPYDILLAVFDYVTLDEMLALMTSSTHVFEITCNSTFWKYMLRLHILPWFWELKSFLAKTTLPEAFDYKGLFVWIHKSTQCEFGFEGPFMGIANRRRIWHACQQLVPLYKERTKPIAQVEPADEEAEAILSSAKSLHMAMVSFPQPKMARTISAQFIRSWSEVSHRSCDFETYWNEQSALVGIAVTLGAHKRVFGSTDGKAGLPLHIEAREWIQEIRVFIGDCNMIDGRQDHSGLRSPMDATPRHDVHINGMEVILTSGKTKIVKYSRNNQRPFVVLPHMHLVGLTGQIAPNGVISSLGLLQSCYPDEQSRTPPAYNPVQRMLWSHSACSIYNPHAGGCAPIWNNPYYRVQPLCPRAAGAHNVPTEMLPHEIMLWAETPSSYQYLKSIAALIVVGDQTKQLGSDEAIDIPDIVGFRPFKIHVHGSAPYIGSGGPVPCQSEEWNASKHKADMHLHPLDLQLHEKFKPFDERFMQHFEIDGPGGEVVTEVHVRHDARAIRLVTNRQREYCWGMQKQQAHWYSKVASEDECIVGLSVCFGDLNGWSWAAKMFSHWKVSEVGVVVCKKDGGQWK